MVDPALAQLERLIESENQSTSLSAVKDILDRAGLKQVDKLKFQGLVEVEDPGREKLTDENLAKLLSLAEAAAESEGN